LNDKTREQPYERFLSCGPQSLTNAELLGIILRTGTKGATAVDLGRQILHLHDPEGNSLSMLPQLTMEELRSICGIGEVKAVKLLCLSEIARRIVREKVRIRPRLDSPDLIADYYMEELRHLDTERTILLHMDSKMALLGEDVMTIGTVNGALISPREIFIKALERRAVQIVLIHNHPSGDPSPSREDIRVTRQLIRSGSLLGIRLVDHIIIGDLCYCSLNEMGLITDENTEF
jgi:DNA repair protein RadC